MNKRDKLKEFRNALGLTLEQMAKRLECTTAYYNNLELGKQFGSQEFWNNFQDTFGIEDEQMWGLVKINK